MKIYFDRDSLKIRGHVFGQTGNMQHAVILSHGYMANERMCYKYAKMLAEMAFLPLRLIFAAAGLSARAPDTARI